MPIRIHHYRCNAGLSLALKRGQGFTLMELLVTMSIFVILASIALPSFQESIINNRLTAQTNNLVSDLSYAKNESVTRNKNVVICSSSNVNSASPVCSGSTQWERGRLIFVDADGDGVFGAGDTLLKVTPLLEGRSTLSTIPSATNMVFLPFGGIGQQGGARISLCASSSGKGRNVTLSKTGKTVVIPATGCPT